PVPERLLGVGQVPQLRRPDHPGPDGHGRLTPMRVTQTTTAAVMLQGIENSYDAFQNLSAQIASGQAVNKPSDNPAGAVQILSYNAEIARLGQYQSNMSDGLAWLGSADSALSSVETSL